MRCTPPSPRCRRSTPTQCSLRGPRFPQSYGGCDFRMQSLPFGAKKKLLGHVLADPCLDNARLYCSLQPLKTCCHCLSRQAKGIDRMSAYKSPKQDAVVMGFSDCKHTEDIVLSRTDTTDALWVFTLVIVLVLHTLSVIGRNRTDSQGMPMASLLVVIGGAMGSMLATSRKPFGIGSLFPGGNRPTRCHAHSSDVAAGGRCSDSGSVVTGADRGVTVSGVARPRRRGQRCSVDAISVTARFFWCASRATSMHGLLRSLNPRTNASPPSDFRRAAQLYVEYGSDPVANVPGVSGRWQTPHKPAAHAEP